MCFVITNYRTIKVQVAIKVFDKETVRKKNDSKRLAREMHILQQMRHPHIIRVYEMIETPSNLFIAMELVDNGELFDLIKSRKRLDEKLAAKIFSQLISSVAYMHSLNFAHRDLKPENILLTNNLDIRIVDFGLGTPFEDGRELSSSCGSPCYALPQMLVGASYTATQADLWSAGVVLFAMVCGYLPFQDTDIRKLYKKIMEGELQFIPELSEDVMDLLRNILHRDRKKRYHLEEIRFHRWLVKNCKQFYQDYKTTKQALDKDVLTQMQTYGVETQYAKRCLNDNCHNFATTLYYLLCKKNRDAALQGGGSSTAISIKDTKTSADEVPILSRQRQTDQPTEGRQSGTFHQLRSQIVSFEPSNPKKTSLSKYQMVSTIHSARGNSQTPLKLASTKHLKSLSKNNNLQIQPINLASKRNSGNSRPKSNSRKKSTSGRSGTNCYSSFGSKIFVKKKSFVLGDRQKKRAQYSDGEDHNEHDDRQTLGSGYIYSQQDLERHKAKLGGRSKKDSCGNRNEEYFVVKKNKEGRAGKKKTSMYQKIESEGYNHPEYDRIATYLKDKKNRA